MHPKHPDNFANVWPATTKRIFVFANIFPKRDTFTIATLFFYLFYLVLNWAIRGLNKIVFEIWLCLCGHYGNLKTKKQMNEAKKGTHIGWYDRYNCLRVCSDLFARIIRIKWMGTQNIAMKKNGQRNNNYYWELYIFIMCVFLLLFFCCWEFALLYWINLHIDAYTLYIAHLKPYWNLIYKI